MSTDLIGTFNDAVNFFNTGSAKGSGAGAAWNSLEGLLDLNIIVKKVDDPKDILVPRSTVMAYLRGQTDKPIFKTTSTPTCNPLGPKSAVISGAGQYQDKAYAAFEDLAYCFILSQDSTGNWLILHVWGGLLATDGSIEGTSATLDTTAT